MGETIASQQHYDQRLDKIENNINELGQAMLGGKYNKGKGLVNIVDDHEERISLMERTIEKYTWLLIGLSAGSGVGIYEIIKNIITK